jgi:hypothetical protein
MFGSVRGRVVTGRVELISIMAKLTTRTAPNNP